MSTTVRNWWKQPGDTDPTSWITALTRTTPGGHHSSCPKGPPGSEEPRSHQGTPRQGRSLRALLYPVATASQCRPRGALTGRDRHPGVGTPVGSQKSRAPAVDPWTKL